MGSVEFRAVRILAMVGGAVAMAAPPLSAFAARQVTVAPNTPKGTPSFTQIQECLNCTVTLSFIVKNTGVPADVPATLTINETLAKVVNTDTDNDVVQLGSTDQGQNGAGICGATLAAASMCTVTATFNIRDGDPNDVDNPKDDFGGWNVGVDVHWAVTVGNSTTMSVASAGGRIDVTDQPVGVPEPATWATIGLGLGLAGLAMRRRRASA